MAYKPYYDKDGTEYKIRRNRGGERRVFTLDNKPTNIDVNSVSPKKPKPITKKTEAETLMFSKAYSTPDSSRTDAQKDFLGEYAPKLFPQYIKEEPVDPLKGMDQFQKADYRLNTMQGDSTYVGTTRAVADSSTVYDKTKLPQFMTSGEKKSEINELNKDIKVLKAQMKSYIVKREGKADYVSKENKPKLEEAQAKLEYLESELLKIKRLKLSDPYGFFTND